ncbi:MAG: hypothetical protein ACKPKO_08110, partial [Candidatus Fonsibacter sp.]
MVDREGEVQTDWRRELTAFLSGVDYSDRLRRVVLEELGLDAGFTAAMHTAIRMAGRHSSSEPNERATEPAVLDGNPLLPARPEAAPVLEADRVPACNVPELGLEARLTAAMHNATQMAEGSSSRELNEGYTRPAELDGDPLLHVRADTAPVLGEDCDPTRCDTAPTEVITVGGGDTR